ncbi:hypothetical protein ACHAXR_012221 [Thalassiosira sp. AJA248-18]
MNSINENQSNHYEEDGSNEFMDRQSSLSDVTHGSDSSSPSASQPKKKKVKVEQASPNLGAYVGMAGDPNMLALGSMGFRPPPAFHPNFNLAFGTGLPMASLVGHQPTTMQMGFPGTSPGFHTMGHAASHPLFGYGPGYAMAHQHHPTAANPAGDSDTPDARTNNDEQGSEGLGGEGVGQQPKPISGMTPFTFAPAGMPINNQMVARAPGHDGNFHPAVLQVVSTDSQMENGGTATTTTHQLAMVPFGNVVALQEPKKWVRWSEQEDLVLRRSVEQWGENNFRHISEQVFHGTRTEVQCKNRWKKALQPGLVKGRWTKEEDNIITESVAAGNMKWSDIAGRLPGRIGEQVKERWVNMLDPEVKKGVWTEAEMKILRDSQKELGNKWSEIAKRIPGRSENSVKNRWYNQKTVSMNSGVVFCCSAQKKKRDTSLEESMPATMSHHHHHHNAEEQEDALQGPMMGIPPQLEHHEQLYEHEDSDEEEDYKEDYTV